MTAPLVTDIFATKGVEYLLVIGYLIVLPFFLKFLTSTEGEGRNEKHGGD